MITNFIFLIILKQIFNYDYYFHIKVEYTCKLSINQNDERTINNLNEDVIIPIRNRPLEEVIKSKIKSIYCYDCCFIDSCCCPYNNNIVGYIN
jgi:hypothetical protein